jgi:UDP-N-acetylglucosamine--N-acetylmuramyl-(pentapeptide) pyrophosphoryl-undecaprenol N-acetylglucosamine transferase
MTRIVIAAGGTAGHVVPALAVADALRSKGAQIDFIGGARAEATLVAQAGYTLHRIDVEGISRSNPLKALRALAKAANAVFAARRLLKQLKPDAVLGGGGYVSGPVGLAAIWARIPLLITEADSHLGITNRILAYRARRVFLAFAIKGRSGGRYRVTGRPIPPLWTDRASARLVFNLGQKELCVLIFGGSLGARSINEATAEGFSGAPYRIIHVAGARDEPALRERGVGAGPGYELRDYISPFAQALAAADIVVARSGGSVFEIAAYGLPSILIPYPHAAADHQTQNALWMVDGGAAVIVPDEQVTAQRLRNEVDKLVADSVLRGRMGAAARALARPDAAQVIANEVLEVVG